VINISLVQLKKVLNSPSLFIENIKSNEYLSLLGFKQLKGDVFKSSLDVMTLRVLDSLGYELEPRLKSKIKEEVVKDFGKFKTEMLLDYQREVLEFSLRNKNIINGIQMGLGKTPSSLAYAEYYNKPTLIICPASLKFQWQKEIKKFTVRDFCEVTVIDGPAKKRKESWEFNENFYKICSYDLMRQLPDFKYAKKFIESNTLILDEVTKAKNLNAKRTKAIFKLRKLAENVIGLTGTPIERNLEEFYNIIELINPGLLDKNVFDDMFLIKEERYFGPKKVQIVIGSKKWNIPILKKVLQPVMIRKETKDVLNLPPTSTITLDCEMDKTQKLIEDRLYELSKEDFGLMEFDKAASPLKWFIFAIQNMINPSIINTELFEDDYRCGKLINLISGYQSPSPRLKITLDFIDSTDDQLIIFSTSVKGLNLLESFIEEKCSKVTGETNTLESFIDHSNRILLLSFAGSYGLNLQNCNKMLILNYPYNYTDLEQLKGRVWRMGQKQNVIYYEVHSDSRIEERINTIVTEKKDLSKRVLSYEAMR